MTSVKQLGVGLLTAPPALDSGTPSRDARRARDGETPGAGHVRAWSVASDFLRLYGGTDAGKGPGHQEEVIGTSARC